MSLEPGTRLGPYEILAPLGEGGMGEVHRARDTRLGREVAIKVIRGEGARDPERVERFEQEARAAGALSHAHVCAVHDVGTHDGAPFVVMELLDGESLRARLDRGALPLRKALEVGAQAAAGLAAAHAKGIVHRDFKPENVFLTKDGRAKVLDFGIAKFGRVSVPANPATATHMPSATGEGALLGTSSYMAPEQIRGEEIDARADVFALGVVLHEMIAGRRPFEGRTPADVMSAILNADPVPLAAVRPDVPPALDRLVRRCLARDRERRVQTSLDVRNELEDLRQELDTGSAAEPGGAKPVERFLTLTAEHVRQLSVRTPRLVGYRLKYMDNGMPSDTLIVLLPGVGSDSSRFERVLRATSRRAIALSLAGFELGATWRPALSVEDQGRLLRVELAALVAEIRPTTTILVGHSAGADQWLRMIDSEEGLGVPVDGLVVLGPNVSLETCFISRVYMNLDPRDPDGMLRALKAVGSNIQSLNLWLTLLSYVSHTFLKLGTDLEGLHRYSADIVAPFEGPGEPMADWYRAARERVRAVRFVFSEQEAAPAEALLARHLEENILGDAFTVPSYVTEDVHHVALTEPALVLRHVEDVLAELATAAS